MDTKDPFAHPIFEISMNDKPSILIVDDEPDYLEILIDALKDDYRIKVAKNGGDALKVAKKEKSFNLILLDVLLPDASGYEICQQLKEDPRTAQIPIIFITAVSDVGHEAKGLELGAIDYIAKPFSIPIVKARIKHHLKRELYRNHLEELVTELTTELAKANSSLNEMILKIKDELRI
ncbi:MAG: response regulator [bacterium]